MTTCSHCHNDYAQAFVIRTADGAEHAFDSFECAISALAPLCGRCGCQIIGHGIDTDAGIFCCAHCARQSGQPAAVDNTRERS